MQLSCLKQIKGSLLPVSQLKPSIFHIPRSLSRRHTRARFFPGRGPKRRQVWGRGLVCRGRDLRAGLHSMLIIRGVCGGFRIGSRESRPQTGTWKNIICLKTEGSLARVRVENVLSLGAGNLQEHRGRSRAQKGPRLACGNTGSIWNKSHMEKRTEETI